MANIKSAKKRAIQSEKRHLVNVARRSAVKTAVKKVLNSLAHNDNIEETKTLFLDAQKLIARASGKGVLHANTAARKIGRLARRCNDAAKDSGSDVQTKKAAPKKKVAAKKKVATKKAAATKKSSTAKKTVAKKA